MKQIELRLALVLYGGVSLAVYMHGVTRELLNLVRASRRWESVAGRAADATGAAARRPEPGTVTAVYFDLFDKLAPELDLRVVVDVIAGASAGGINGVMLGRAIAHDLSMDGHRDLWLENADVTRLSNEPVGLSRYLKSSIAPVLDRLAAMGLRAETSDPETREKLRQFVQARWFTPPFSGTRFVGWMLDACRAMTPVDDVSDPADATLIPQGQRLDLFVTLTDFYGHRRRFDLDQGGLIEEREHRRILRFRAHHRTAGEVQSEFDDDRVPDLVFAARATSSFPGAFPPMTVAEMDTVLADRGEIWSGRDTFLAGALGQDPEGAVPRVFVDGSVVMNKPFQPVIETIADRAAGREVVRRLVYVDPLPERQAPAAATVPGFFRVIFASLAHIPRNEPIGDALDHVEQRNREARHIADVIAAAEPAVEREVARILRLKPDRPLTLKQLTRARLEANETAHVAAGYAHLGYQRMKLRAVTERVSSLLSSLATGAGVAAAPAAIGEKLSSWIDAAYRAEPEATTPAAVVSYLKGLDVDYRIRRLRFVIRRLNRLYRQTALTGTRNSAEMDEVKTTLYEQIDHLSRRWTLEFYGSETAKTAAALARASVGDFEAVETMVAALTARMGLDDLDKLHDDVFAVMTLNYLDPEMRVALTSAYVGFAFYDLITLPVVGGADVSEVNEIKIDRISPSDPHTLRPDGLVLKGTNLSAFGAFFNRRWREHDYLWGRLNAADRLLTMVLAAAEPEKRLDEESEAELRRSLFEAILREEQPHLSADPTLVPDLLREVAGLQSIQPADETTADL